MQKADSCQMNDSIDLRSDKQEKRTFYKMLVTLVIPITVQYLINTAVSSVDVIMLKYVGQDALTAVSLATQITFVMGLFFFGMSAGASILTAQYWGKKDMETIGRLMGIAIRSSLLVSFIFTVLAFFIPEKLMLLYTSNPVLVENGALYLRTVAFSYLCMGFTTLYLNIIRGMERVRFPALVYLISLLSNILFNALFLFGWFGIPKMGIFGVALATTLSRCIELILCVFDARKNRLVRLQFSTLFMRTPLLEKDFIRLSVPAMANEIAWGVGTTMYTIIVSHLSDDIVAANSIVSVISNLASVLGFGLSSASSIIIGKALGEGKIETAKLYAKRLMWVIFGSCILCAGVILALRPFVLSFSSTLTEVAQQYVEVLLWINIVYVSGAIMNTELICGIFRAGGDVKYGVIIDVITLWGVAIPIGWFCGYILKLPPLLVYFIIHMDEIGKLPFNMYHYFKKRWANNITRDAPLAE